MLRRYKYYFITIVCLLLITSCENSGDLKDNDIQKETPVNTIDNIAGETDHNNSEHLEESRNENLVDSVIDIFRLQNQYFSHQFTYKKLVEKLDEYMDDHNSLISPKSVYGFIDPSDESSGVINKDTEDMDEIEFDELINNVELFIRPGDIITISQEDDNVVYSAIKYNKSEYYCTAAITREDGSKVIYMKEILRFDSAALEMGGFDCIVNDYWFLYKDDSQKVYSYKKNAYNIYYNEVNFNKVIMFDEEIDVITRDVTSKVIME